MVFCSFADNVWIKMIEIAHPSDVNSRGEILESNLEYELTVLILILFNKSSIISPIIIYVIIKKFDNVYNQKHNSAYYSVRGGLL